MIDLLIKIKDKAYRERFIRLFKLKYGQDFNVLIEEDFIYSRQLVISDYEKGPNTIYLSSKKEDGAIYKYQKTSFIYRQIKAWEKGQQETIKGQLIGVYNLLSYRLYNPIVEDLAGLLGRNKKILLINFNSLIKRRENSFSLDSLIINYKLKLNPLGLVDNKLNLDQGYYYLNPVAHPENRCQLSFKAWESFFKRLKTMDFDYILLDKHLAPDSYDFMLLRILDRSFIFLEDRKEDEDLYRRIKGLDSRLEGLILPDKWTIEQARDLLGERLNV